MKQTNKNMRSLGKAPGNRATAVILSVALLLSSLVAGVVNSEPVRRALAEGSDNALERIFSLLGGSNTNPKTFLDYEALANIAIAKEQYEEALPHLDQCIALCGEEDAQTLAALWVRKGSVLALLLRYDEAVEALDSALSFDPNTAQALMLRAQIFIDQEKLEQAAADMEAYLSLLPEDAQTWSALAQVYETLSQYDRARSCYDRSFALDREDTVSLLNRARSGYLAGDYENALADYNLFLEENGDTGGVGYFLRGACLMQMFRYEEAISDMLAAIENGYPDEALCYEQLSVCAYVLERHEDALLYADKTLELSSDTTALDVLYQRKGVSQMALERYGGAVEDLTASIAINPELEGSFYYRGVCNLALDALDEAIDDFTGSIERGFLPQFCYYNRGVCYVRKIEYDKALDDMEMTMTVGDDPELLSVARDILWQMAQYYLENQKQPDQPLDAQALTN